ncbi:restriction endonuclease subunit S [Anabaena lutea]|uniref:Restriction endonuclease subunit S n=1 Tax=Anabaena lutea FACHB-196 TaxID=2692881 RepID=A0ABR8FBQ1_9NOST|nr:restriction endonuclease subunit S [Anabaena lutea]MBD2566647.1 restriction endonuclease subunit S [Anabaena lutea FACHB-196]
MQLTVDSGQLPVGWNVKYLDELCENLDSKRIPITKSSRKSGNIPYYGASGIVDYVADYIFNEDLLLVSEDGANLLARTYPIAFSITGKTWVNNHAHVLRFKENITQIFVEFYLNSISLESYVSGMAQPKLNQKSLNSIPIPIPPLPEQKRIVAILDEAFEGIDRAISNTEKNLSNARELFESYLNSIFSPKGEGWEEKKLEDICSITSKLVDPRQPEFIDLPHIGAGNMISITGELIEVKTARQEQLISGKFLFDETMVLYSKIRPYLMKACRPEFSGLCSADVYPLLPNNEELNRDFLFYILMSRDFTNYAISGSDRAAMPKVNRDHLFRYSTWIPSISEQINIAQKIDDLFTETQRLENIYRQKIAALKELKQSILQKAFTGELTADNPKTAKGKIAA